MVKGSGMKKGRSSTRVQVSIKSSPESNLNLIPQRSTGDNVELTQHCCPIRVAPHPNLHCGQCKFPGTSCSARVQAKMSYRELKKGLDGMWAEPWGHVPQGPWESRPASGLHPRAREWMVIAWWSPSKPGQYRHEGVAPTQRWVQRGQHVKTRSHEPSAHFLILLGASRRGLAATFVVQVLCEVGHFLIFQSSCCWSYPSCQ